MSNKTEIVETILKRESEFLIDIGRPLPQDFSHDYYYADIEDNLWAGKYTEGKAIMYPHLELDYEPGSGGELLDGKTPAKMKSIRSSSAMTYNLLGNTSIKIVNGKGILQNGTYNIKYEKQLLTLKNNPRPANLDAYLYDEDNNAAIFCEMKMLEWLTAKPGCLKEAYLEPTKYFATSNKTTHTFIQAIRALQKVMPKHYEAGAEEVITAAGEILLDKYGNQKKEKVKGHIHRFEYYDAWQMFKHMLGIYNMTSKITRSEIERVLKRSNKINNGLLPELCKVTLVNVVFEPPENIFESLEIRRAYKQILETEHEEFVKYKDTIKQSGVIEAFQNDCGIDFDIIYMNTAQFMDCFDLGERKDYLNRYRL